AGDCLLNVGREHNGFRDSDSRQQVDILPLLFQKAAIFFACAPQTHAVMWILGEEQRDTGTPSPISQNGKSRGHDQIDSAESIKNGRKSQVSQEPLLYRLHSYRHFGKVGTHAMPGSDQLFQKLEISKLPDRQSRWKEMRILSIRSAIRSVERE